MIPPGPRVFKIKQKASGEALVMNGIAEPREVAHLHYNTRTFEYYVGMLALKRTGPRVWRNVRYDQRWRQVCNGALK